MKCFAFVFCFMLPYWAVAENYLCISDEATGFVKRGGRYQQTNFISDKYIVNAENRIVRIFWRRSHLCEGSRSKF